MTILWTLVFTRTQRLRNLHTYTSIEHTAHQSGGVASEIIITYYYTFSNILAKLQKHKIHFHVASVSYVYCVGIGECVYAYLICNGQLLGCMIRAECLDKATWRPTFANFKKISYVLNSNIYNILIHNIAPCRANNSDYPTIEARKQLS